MKLLAFIKEGSIRFVTTEYFDAENHFNNEIGMAVLDLSTGKAMYNGIDWVEVEEDHL